MGERPGLGSRRPGPGTATPTVSSPGGAEISSIPNHPSLSHTLSSLCCDPATKVVCQFQGWHTDPASQGENTQGHQEVEEWSLLDFAEVGWGYPGLAEPSAAPQRLCGSTLASFYFYFIFKMKHGQEMEKRERRNEKKGEGKAGARPHSPLAGLHLAVPCAPPD